eukprot:1147937-Pelagomonas_calceolata.AAC.1
MPLDARTLLLPSTCTCCIHATATVPDTGRPPHSCMYLLYPCYCHCPRLWATFPQDKYPAACNP